MYAMAVQRKGDGDLISNKYAKGYGEAHFAVQSFYAPDFKMTTTRTVNVLRSIGFFMSMYGYYQIELDVFDGDAGSVKLRVLILPF